MRVQRSRRLPLGELAPYLLEAPPTPNFLDWRAVFGNDNPVELEVGFGKGLFLLTAAQAAPATNFFGVEVSRKYQLFTATRFAKREHPNVRLVRADGRLFLRDSVAPGSLRAVHVYFPDPWWKSRHMKRRLFTTEFVAACQRVIQPGGRLYIATDVSDYFAVMTDLLAQVPQLMPLDAAPIPEVARGLDHFTNFERKFRAEGRSIYRAVYQKQTE